MPERRVSAIKVVDGMIHASMMQREVTSYLVTGALDAARSVMIEHPRRDGWKFTAKAADGESATHHRLRVRLGAGEQAAVDAVQEIVADEVYGLADADPQMLVSWSGSADKATASKLKELADARREQVAAQRDVSRIAEEIRQVEAGQTRVRQNLAAVPQGSDLQKVYLDMLSEQETRLAELEKRKKGAEEASRSHSDEVDGIIRTF